jgi:hypothetical protein
MEPVQTVAFLKLTAPVPGLASGMALAVKTQSAWSYWPVAAS